MQAFVEILAEILSALLSDAITSRGQRTAPSRPRKPPAPESLDTPRSDPWNDPRRAEEPAPRPLLDEQRLRR